MQTKQYLLIILLLLLLTNTFATDTNAPVTTFSSFQTPQKTDQNITLSCTDSESGCRYLNYKIDNNQWVLIVGDTNKGENPTYSGLGDASGAITDTAFKYTAITSFYLERVQLNLPASVSNQVIEVWSHNAGTDKPLAKLNTSQQVSGSGDKNFIFTSPQYIATGTIFWLNVHVDSGTLAYKNATGATNTIQNKRRCYSNTSWGTCDTAVYLAAYLFASNNVLANYNFIYSGVGDHNIQYFSTDSADNNEATKTSTFTTVGETTYPVVLYTIDKSFGFSSDFNIPFTITCRDSWLDDINYSVYLNDTNLIYTALDANNKTKSSYYVAHAKDTVKLTFSCTNKSGNQTTATAPLMYAVLFRLVKEETGVQLTYTDINTNFNTARVYTPDGNYSYDFNATATTTTNFIAPNNSLYFEFKYKDTAGTILNRQIDFSLTDDYNIAVCVPFYQTFYQQRFISTSQKQMVLKSDVSHCYVIADTLKYIYDTGYSLTTYTIVKPYYLYTFSNGVKNLLALVDGGVATQYNLDAIEFSRIPFELKTGVDTVAFAPHGVDTNYLEIYYHNYKQNSVRTILTIFNGDTTLFTYSDTNSPNDIYLLFNYADMGLSDQNVLKLVVTAFDSSDNVTQSNYYFTTNGASQINKVDNSWAVIVAVLFFIFGITLVSVGRTFGFFGIIICLISIGLSAYASNAWWVSMIQVAFFIIMIFIILSGKQSNAGGSGIV